MDRSRFEKCIEKKYDLNISPPETKELKDLFLTLEGIEKLIYFYLEGTIIGEISFNESNTDDIEYNVELDKSVFSKELPKKYKLAFPRDLSPQHLFYFDNNTCNWTYRVNKCFTLNPVESLSYINQLKQRTFNSTGGVIQAPILEEPLSTAQLPSSQADEFFIARKRKLEEKEDISSYQNKRNKTDRNILENQIFSLFQSKSHWSLREMNERLRQPDEHVKSILSEIANYITSGEHKGEYELKSEYEI